MILYMCILNALRHVSWQIALGVTVRGDCRVPGEGRFVGIPKFYSWVTKCTMPNTYQLRLDVEHLLLAYVIML